MYYNPINIFQCHSSQLSYINFLVGNFYYVTDLGKIYADLENGRVLATDIVILQYERERDNFIPNNYDDFPTEPGFEIPHVLNDIISYVYVVETNCLYSYKNAVWSTLYGKYGSTVVAQTYYPNGTIVKIYADDVTTNGILNDGSVVIRDNNKMICGLLNSDGYLFNLKSLIGGCINISPSGDEKGTLQLNANTSLENASPTANLNGDLIVFGDIKTTDSKNWNKQYRLVTENLSITINTTIKKGSLLKAGSQVNSNKYDTDIILTEDLNFSDGLITKGSKLYINSIINGNDLQPPYLFDISEIDSSNLSIVNIAIDASDITIDNDILVLDIDKVFTNTGDTFYINTEGLSNINNLRNVRTQNGEYEIDYIANSGITNTAKIVYYNFNKKVKILP